MVTRAEVAAVLDVGVAKLEAFACVGAAFHLVLELDGDGAPVRQLAAAVGPDSAAAPAVVPDLGGGAGVVIGDDERPVDLAGDGEVHRLRGHRGREGCRNRGGKYFV